MAKTKKSRKQLLSTNDEFITFSGRMLAYAGEHKKQLNIAGYCIIVAALLFIGGNYYFKSLNTRAQDVYNTGLYTISENMNLDKSEEELTKSRENFTKVLADYKMSKVATLTLPQIAYIDFLEKKYDDAISKYQEYLNSASEAPYSSYALLALSVCFEEKKDYDNAISTLEKVTAGEDDYCKEQAMLSLARIYRSQNNYAKSDEILKDFIEKFPASASLEIAKAALTS
ncbi:MAG: tetratricopeptide repeat protein [Desulfobacteraceae bacterium]|jgi:predicted negative regulator of RcsB-dependent stress response